jgi:hypothetical protein
MTALSISFAAMEQLFSPGSGFYHPGLATAGAILARQVQQNPEQVG